MLRRLLRRGARDRAARLAAAGGDAVAPALHHVAQAAQAGPPGVRHNPGAPFRVFGGGDVGARCVVDGRPRPPASIDGRAYLAAVSRQVGRLLERRLGSDGDLAA